MRLQSSQRGRGRAGAPPHHGMSSAMVELGADTAAPRAEICLNAPADRWEAATAPAQGQLAHGSRVWGRRCTHQPKSTISALVRREGKHQRQKPHRAPSLADTAVVKLLLWVSSAHTQNQPSVKMEKRLLQPHTPPALLSPLLPGRFSGGARCSMP